MFFDCIIKVCNQFYIWLFITIHSIKTVDVFLTIECHVDLLKGICDVIVIAY